MADRQRQAQRLDEKGPLGIYTDENLFRRRERMLWNEQGRAPTKQRSLFEGICTTKL